MGRPRIARPPTPYDAVLSRFPDEYGWNATTRRYYRKGSSAGQLAGKTLGVLIRTFLASAPGPYLHKTALDRLVEDVLECIRENEE